MYGPNLKQASWRRRSKTLFAAGPRAGMLVEHPAIERAVDYLQSRFSEDLSLEQSAAHACLSRYEFSRQFHAVAGTTYSNYLAEIRVREAALRIAECPHQSLTRVALEVGFGTLRTFELRFKRHFGETPCSFRRRARCAWYAHVESRNQHRLSHKKFRDP